jgi:hypothetical protein
MTQESKKVVYRRPEIVDMGDVRAITLSGGSPLRDNNNDELRTYENGAKLRPSLDGVNAEVDLGDK